MSTKAPKQLLLPMGGIDDHLKYLPAHILA